MHSILSENQYSTPLLKTATAVKNPSEPAAVVSFCEYSRKLEGWERWRFFVFEEFGNGE